MKIGFVTSSAEIFATFFPTAAEPNFVPVEPLFTPDDQLAVDALRAKGFTVNPIVWGSLLHTLSGFDLIIVRSPWDYMENDNMHKFLTWIDQLEKAGFLVLNPPSFMKWMLDKHYLQDLQNQGINVIPTQYYEAKADLDLEKTFKQRGEFIVKPCISAAGIGLYHIQSEDEAKKFQNELNSRLQQCGYMLQDVIPEIKTNGEWSLVFLGGEYSHAVHKKPAGNSILVHAERGGSLHFTTPPAHIIQFAKQAYPKIIPAYQKATGNQLDDDLLLYLRLDVIDTTRGPVVVECEAVEPELFFRAQEQAAQNFVKAIMASNISV